MEVAISIDSQKKIVILKTSEPPSKGDQWFLKEIGFQKLKRSENSWYVRDVASYKDIASQLKQSIENNTSWQNLTLTPSIVATKKNIEARRYGIVTIELKDNSKEKYLVFETYTKIATLIVLQFAKQTFKDNYKNHEITYRTDIAIARELFKRGRIIARVDNLSHIVMTESTDKNITPTKEITQEKSKTSPLTLVTNKPQENSKSLARDILVRDLSIPNVLVPKAAPSIFQSGDISYSDAPYLEKEFPELYSLTYDSLKTADALILFKLSQMPHPTDYGIAVHRSSLLQAWQAQSEKAFIVIGFPVESSYPYVNIHTGYKSVSSLDSLLGSDGNAWWAVVEHYRPIADPEKGIEIIEKRIAPLKDELISYINPKTKKVKSDKASKEAYHHLTWEIERFEASKEVIIQYLDSIKETPITKNTATSEDYIDRVIAVMHSAYLEGKRLSKKKVEALLEDTNTPNLGALWEAVELSWLLWYKTIYKEPIPFKERLSKMIHFWNNLQPTYAYSDSSKELYKQYSTPCPIGAILAQYTQMDSATAIFEPSAGNGLLLVGADPNKTRVNEIDRTRISSLTFQGFLKITSNNAALPFDRSLHKQFDVMVTNPPFARWEASRFDKERIAKKYFNSHYNIRHIRLEHLMAGLALTTLKDTGRAGIIIMGHMYFASDGLIAKYRPFFNWLYRHYIVDDIINLNSFKLYNKQGAVAKTMLILIGGRKPKPSSVAPNQSEAPHLERVVEDFQSLYQRVLKHTLSDIDTLISQLNTATIL